MFQRVSTSTAAEMNGAVHTRPSNTWKINNMRPTDMQGGLHMAISTVMASQQPCKKAKGSRPIRGEAQRFSFPLYFIIIFLKQITRFLVKHI